MCKKRIFSSLVFLLFVCLLFPSISLSIDAKAKIDSEAIKSGVNEVSINGQYPSVGPVKYEIEAVTGAATNAKIKVTDAAVDTVRLVNVKITAKDDNVTGHIEFWGEDFGPDPNQDNYVDTVTSGSAFRWVQVGPFKLKRAAQGSKVYVSGAFVHPVDDTWKHVYSGAPPIVPPPSPYEFEHTVGADTGVFNTSVQITEDMDTDGRRYKGVLHFYLKKNGDWFEFPDGAGITVKGKDTGGQSCASGPAGSFYNTHAESLKELAEEYPDLVETITLLDSSC